MPFPAGPSSTFWPGQGPDLLLRAAAVRCRTGDCIQPPAQAFGRTRRPRLGWGRQCLPRFPAWDGAPPSRGAAALRALLGLGWEACCFLISGWEEAAFGSGRDLAVQNEIPCGEDAPDGGLLCS